MERVPGHGAGWREMDSWGSAQGAGTNWLECSPADHRLHRSVSTLISQQQAGSDTGAAAIKPAPAVSPGGEGGESGGRERGSWQRSRCYLHTASLPSVLGLSLSKLHLCAVSVHNRSWDVRGPVPHEGPQRTGCSRFSIAVAAERPWRDGSSLCLSLVLCDVGGIHWSLLPEPRG